jgi:hypothetical protein
MRRTSGKDTAGLLDPGREPLGERVPGRGAAGVDRLAVLAVLRRLEEQVPGDLDDLAVDGDDTGDRLLTGSRSGSR